MGNLLDKKGGVKKVNSSSAVKDIPSSKDTLSNSSESSTIDNDIFARNNNNNTELKPISYPQQNGGNNLDNGKEQKYSITGKHNFTKLGNDQKMMSFAHSALQAGGLVSRFGSERGAQMLTLAAIDGNAIDDEIFKNFDYPFTNLVFEGGGNKGMAYVGALQVLEDAGITKKIHRVAGASVGAITATLFAVGFRSQQLKDFMEGDLKSVLVDHKCGYCSLLPNLITGFGWNPGKRLLKWFGEQLKEQTGDADITFREVYKKYGCEVCIVVTNLSQMSTEYFHPKTTPNTPIRTAVRMSIALPGVFQSVKYQLDEQNTDVFVDGGLLCNYPIHAFDGWWLSMDTENSFFKKLQPLEDYAHLFAKNERFGSWNTNTLGIMLYSHSETELMKTKLAERLGRGPSVPKVSKLYRSRRKVRIQQESANQEHKAVVSAIGRFMKELHRLHFDLDGTINLQELRKVFEVSTEFTVADQLLLFGHADFEEAFSELDRDSDGEVTFQELMSFVERKGVNIQTRFLGYTRKEINNIGDFISTLQTALAINVKRNYVEDRDIERTIGIDTDYIEANDFYLEECDKKFLLESGAAAARAFLRHYCQKHNHRRKKSAMLSRTFFEPEYQAKIGKVVIEEKRDTGSPSDGTMESGLSRESPGSLPGSTLPGSTIFAGTPEKTLVEVHHGSTSHHHNKSSKSLRRTPSQIEEEDCDEVSPYSYDKRPGSDVSEISLNYPPPVR